jgi:HK97 family phage portal protein
MHSRSLVDVIARGMSGLGAKSIGTRESGFFSRWGWSMATWSGKHITPDLALSNETVWACVRKISQTVGTLPIGVYERTADGGRAIASGHPLYDLLRNEPNARMSAVNFWQAMSASLLMWGNAYAEVKRTDNRQRVVALNFLHPERMRLWWDQGRLRYEYFDLVGTNGGTGTGRPILPQDLMHVRAFTCDGEVGLSAIQYARNSIGSALAADEAADSVFKDATRASGLVTMDTILQPKQRDQIREHVKQVSREGGVYVLEKGAGFVPLRFNPLDAELLASRSFSVETICRWFDMPPVMIGHGDKQSSWPTSTEAQSILFVRYVLRACLSVIEQEIQRSLLTPAERQRNFAEFALEGLLRGDSAARAAFYASALQNGWMTRNEVRRLENLPPVEGGDILTVQSALVPLDQLGQAPAPADATVRTALLNWLGGEFQSIRDEVKRGGPPHSQLTLHQAPVSVDVQPPAITLINGTGQTTTRTVRHERDPATGLITHSVITDEPTPQES